MMSAQGTVQTACSNSLFPTRAAGFGFVLALGVVACPCVSAQSSVNEAQQQAQDYARQQGAPASEPNYQYPASQYPRGQYPPQQYPQQQPAYNGNYSDPSYANPAYGVQSYAPSPEEEDADEYAADLTAEAANEPPPPLPDYEQPPCPDPDYLWTPGYWGSGPYGFYWVPGAWVAAPYTGALWTPGYWAFVGSAYRFHHGFWGPHIGFYGGISYGHGYSGYGYDGGYWRNNHFFYNTAVNRVNIRVVRNVYAREVVFNDRMVNRVSYDGGRGGLDVRPHQAELAVLREQRIPPMQSQLAIRREAEGNRGQFYNQNHGRPPMAVAVHPVAADRTLPSPLPTRAGMMQGGGVPDANRNGYAGNGNSGRGIYGGTPADRPDMIQRQVQGQLPNGQPQPQPLARPDANRQPYTGYPARQPYTPQGSLPGQQQPNQPGAESRFGYGGRGNYPGQPSPMPQSQPQTHAQPQPQQAQPDFRRGNAPETQITGAPPARVDQAPPQQPQFDGRWGRQGQYQQRDSQLQQREQPQAQPQQQPRYQQPQFEQRQQQQPRFEQRQQQAPQQPQAQRPPQQPEFRQGPEPRIEHPREDRGR